MSQGYDSAWYEDLAGALTGVLVQLSKPERAEQLDTVQHFIDHGEYGVAYEDLVGVLHQQRWPLSPELHAQLVELGSRMELDTAIAEGLADLVH